MHAVMIHAINTLQMHETAKGCKSPALTKADTGFAGMRGITARLS